MKRVILPALAVILAVAVLAGVLIVRTQAGTAKPTARWTTFRDPLGLYNISYPTSWKQNGNTYSSNDWPICNCILGDGAQPLLEASGDNFDITDSANVYAEIQIRAIELNTPDARTNFCKRGTPTSPDFTEHGGTDFNTGNANVSITLGNYGAFAVIMPGDPTTTTAEMHAALSPSFYAPILATFHSLAPKGSSC